MACFLSDKTNWTTADDITYVCMYVCIIEHLCSCRPYSLDCHEGAMEMYRCALENITVFSCAQNGVSDSDGSRAVSGSEFQRSGPEWAKLLCPYRFAYSKRRRGCVALLDVNDSDCRRLLQPGCMTRRGRRVLTDVDTYVRAQVPGRRGCRR